jgi:DNA-binding NarL/FixJ family response regulator
MLDSAQRSPSVSPTGYRLGVPSALRVVVGEDDVLLRAGICRLLEDAGFEVVGQAGDADDLLRKALAHRPDVTLTDVQMPPRHEDDGLSAALELRRQRPDANVLILSQHAEQAYALAIVGDQPAGVGYLLKERIGDVDTFIDAVERVGRGGTALDAEVVAMMLGRRRPHGPLDELTPRELEVLAAIAEGKSNRGIAAALFISEASVEKHVTSIFSKLRLRPDPGESRRVRAALTYLGAGR